MAILKDPNRSIFADSVPEIAAVVEAEGAEKKNPSPLKRKFLVAPFSVLQAYAGEWKKRKKEWIEVIGLRGEQGRSEIETANNICSEEWGRGVKMDDNPDRVLGHGLSESQSRLNAFQRKADAVPGGGGKGSVRRRAANDLGKCFGSGTPGELSAELKDRNVAEEKGYGYAAEHNGGLDEKTQRALGVYAAHGGSVVARQGGTPMEPGLAYGKVPSYDGAARSVAGTSIFDPVLTELLYLWYGKKGGTILDPFAGGGTRGIVAAYHGLQYTGIEVRPGQVAANYENATQCQANAKALGREIGTPNWIVGDSSRLEDILAEKHDPLGYEGDDLVPPRKLFDFLIACPPYYDLEVYSCGAEDGSTKQTYEEFLHWYAGIFRQALDRLAWNRFAAIVVGDIREHDGVGLYRYFVEDTIRPVLSDCKAYPYAKFILDTAKGSLPVRIGQQFPGYRKPGMGHQRVEVFWKGDRDKKAIVAALGRLDDGVFSTGEGDEANGLDT